MLGGRQSVLVRDEFALPEPTRFLWGVTTFAEIELSSHGSATLVRNGKRLTARILEPEGAVFSVASAERPEPEARNEGAKRLEIDLPGASGEITVAVLFTPDYGVAGVTIPPPPMAPLHQWHIPPETSGQLTGMAMDGKPLSSFRPDQRTYHIGLPTGTLIPEITVDAPATTAAEPAAKIDVTGPTCPALVTIKPAGGPEYRVWFVAQESPDLTQVPQPFSHTSSPGIPCLRLFGRRARGVTRRRAEFGLWGAESEQTVTFR